METLYTSQTAEGSHPMPHLGYDISRGDLIPAALISKLNIYTSDESAARKIWGWDRASGTAESQLRVELIIKSWLGMEHRIVNAMGRLDHEVGAMVRKDAEAGLGAALSEYDDAYQERYDQLEQEGDEEGMLRLRAEAARPAGRVGEFTHSLNVASARRIVDWSFDGPSGIGENLLPFVDGFWRNPHAPVITPEERVRIAELIALAWETRIGWPSKSRGVELALYLFLNGPKGKDTPTKEQEAIAQYLRHAVGQSGSRFNRSSRPHSLVEFTDPTIARPVPPGSLSGAGYSFTTTMWRLMDVAYSAQRIADPELRDLVDHCLAIQAEYQLQALFTDREMMRVINSSGQNFEYLKAKAASEATQEKGGSFWGFLGDVLGIVSAVAGVLALIPVLTPFCGPIALAAGAASFGAHLVDAAIKGDWDAMTVVGLGADALALIPGIGAVAKGLKAGRATMKAIGGLKVATKAAGRAFAVEVAGKGASEASAVFGYIGARGAKAVGVSTQAGKIAGKVLQGSVALSTQVPVTLSLAGVDTGAAGAASSGGGLVANYGNSIGNWGAVGTATQKSGTVTLAVLGKILGRG